MTSTEFRRISAHKRHAISKRHASAKSCNSLRILQWQWSSKFTRKQLL